MKNALALMLALLCASAHAVTMQSSQAQVGVDTATNKGIWAVVQTNTSGTPVPTPTGLTLFTTTPVTTPTAYSSYGASVAEGYTNTYNAKYVAQLPPTASAMFPLSPSASETYVFITPSAGTALLNFCNTTAYGTPGNIIYGFSNTSANVGLSASSPAVGMVLPSGSCTGDVIVPGTFFHYINANSCTPSARYDATTPYETGSTKTGPPY